MSNRNHMITTRAWIAMVFLAALMGTCPSRVEAQLGLHSEPLGAGSGDTTEPGSPPGGGAAVDQPAADAATPAGPTAEQLRAVRAAAFTRIDAALGIDSHKLLQERLVAVGATGQLSEPLDAGQPGPAGALGVIRKILTSDKLHMLLGLLPIGSKLDLVRGVVAIIGRVVGGRESAVPGALTDEEIAYMEAHPDDIRRALALEQQRTAPAQETATPEAAAAQDAIDQLVELEQLRRERQASEQASRDAAEETTRRNQRIRELEQQVNQIRPQ